MLFEKLVKQHGVDLLVADRFGLAHGIASHEIGNHLGHFFGDQAKGKRLRGIILLVVTEADRLEPKEHFAGFVHRLDVMFIPARRYVSAAKSSGAGYRDRIRVSPNNGLHVEIGVADIAAAVYVRARCADTDDVTGRGDTAPGI